MSDAATAERLGAAAETSSDDDRRWMDAALALARRGLGRTAPNPPVGAVLVSPDGRVVGRGWTQPGGRPHAEARALAQAGDAARGATLYVTLEPCSHHGRTPPCADSLIAAGVLRVVVAMGDPDPRVSGRGIARLKEHGVAVTLGVREGPARRLAAGHVTRVTLGRPRVALKLGVSADGKVGLPGRKPVAITGEASRARVHLMRAEADAILVGVGTVLADDPSLTCRLPGLLHRSPVRVVLDSDLRTPPTAALVRTAGETASWIVVAEDAPGEAERLLRRAGVEVLRVARGADGRLDLAAALKLLAIRGATRLMVEGGPTVAASLLDAGLIDAVTLITGPAELGPDALDALDGHALDALTASPHFAETSRACVGDDVWTEYERV